MDQGRRLEGLAGGLVGQLLCGKNTEFLIDQGQEFICSLRIPPSIAFRMRVTSLMASLKPRHVHSASGLQTDPSSAPWERQTYLARARLTVPSWAAFDKDRAGCRSSPESTTFRPVASPCGGSVYADFLTDMTRGPFTCGCPADVGPLLILIPTVVSCLQPPRAPSRSALTTISDSASFRESTTGLWLHRLVVDPHVVDQPGPEGAWLKVLPRRRGTGLRSTSTSRFVCPWRPRHRRRRESGSSHPTQDRLAESLVISNLRIFYLTPPPPLL